MLLFVCWLGRGFCGGIWNPKCWDSVDAIFFVGMRRSLLEKKVRYLGCEIDLDTKEGKLQEKA